MTSMSKVLRAWAADKASKFRLPTDERLAQIIALTEEVDNLEDSFCNAVTRANDEKKRADMLHGVLVGALPTLRNAVEAEGVSPWLRDMRLATFERARVALGFTAEQDLTVVMGEGPVEPPR